MIRRTEGAAGAQRWILIAQVEHARLSGALAEAWGQPPYAPLARQIVDAVRRHDDGWADWEVAPKIDVGSGQPLDFTETPLTDSLAIWRASIASASDLGPLAGYMVSGHFSALLERFPARWKAAPALAALANGFLIEQREARDNWLTMWRKTAGETADRAAADRAVAWLQLFDAISLWLCCAERSQPETFTPPSGPPLTLRPTEEAGEIEVSPWPYRVSSLNIEVVGRSIPAARYASPSDVVTAAAEPATLKWSFSTAAAGEKRRHGTRNTTD